MTCPRCKAPAPETAKFCAECGATLSRAASVPDAERRLLTVLFCDLVGSLALSARLDPEVLRDLVQSYQRACAAVIQKFEGHIAQYLGDGILAYFGYPLAHEDDAHRAGRSGLAIVEAVRRLDAQWKADRGVDVHVRVGIHTGLVVIGEIGSGAQREQLATGEAPNVAARIQGIAAPDTVVMSHATYGLVRGYFKAEDLGAVDLKGVARPLPVVRIVSETGIVDRLDASRAEGLSGFVGRAREMGTLTDRWRAAVKGETQTVHLRGEAGIGKSRHLLELKDRLKGQDISVLEGQCSPYYRNSAFHPIIELMEQRYGFTRDMPDGEKLDRLRDRVKALGLADPAEAFTLLANLHSIPLPADHPPLRISPQRQRRRLIETLRDMAVGLARLGPTLLIVEDLHWAEPSTLEWLEELIATVHDSPLLIVLTFRPGFTPPWPPGPTITDVELDPLSDDDGRRIVRALIGAVSLPDAIIHRVLERAGGNPLFVEEVTKSVIEAGALGAGATPSSAMVDSFIPPTVQQSLLARIDRLGPAKALAQVAAVTGNEFSYRLLRAVASMSDDSLHDSLDRLVDAELLFQKGDRPDASFRFKHALIHDTVYQSLVRPRREEHHSTTARILIEQFPDLAEGRPELVAHHLHQSGRPADSIPYWQRAGERAAQRSAYREARSHLTQALELARSLPPSAEQVQYELALSITLGPILMATEGYSDPAVESTYRRAHEICLQIGETPQIVPVLFGLWAFYVVRGNLATARALGEQIVRLAALTGDSGIVLESRVVMGVTLYFLGELEASRAQLEMGLSVYDPAQHRAHATVFGQEPGMASHIYLAKACWMLGDTAAAERHRAEASRIARETEHHQTTAFCLAYEGLVTHWSGDRAATAAIADRLDALADEQGFPIWKACAEVLSGWVAASEGRSADGITLIDSGIARWTAAGTNLYTPYWFGLLAMAELDAGPSRAADALAHAEHALELELSGEERVMLPQLHRIHGDVVRRTSALSQSGLSA